MSGVRTPLLVVGDALLDRDVTGTADRLAPDAPVPVVAERGRRVRPGGAALAARLAADDGRDVTLVTGVGDDPASEELRRLLDGRVRVIGLPLTGALPEKTRVLAQGRPVVRLDRGDGRVREATDEARRAVRSAPAVLVADYGRGAADALRDVLASRPPVVWDPHPRGGPPVAGTRLVTPARSEARAFAAAADDDGRAGADTPTSGLRAAARDAAALVGRWEAASVAVTMGARGALLSYGKHPLFIPAPAAHHGDACGAGDRFAATAAGLLADGALVGTAVEGAVNSASGFVAGGGAGAVTGFVAGGGAEAVTSTSGFIAGGRAGAVTSTSGFIAGGGAGGVTSAVHGAQARHRPRGPAARNGAEAASDGVARDEAGSGEVGPDGAARDEGARDEETPGGAIPDEVARDEAARDATRPGEVGSDGAASDEAAPGEVAPDEAAPGEVAPGEVGPGEVGPEPRAVLARVRAAGGTVVAAGGCFDLLHAGHVRLLQTARRIGDCLIVCVNSDTSVRRRKGKGRPVNPLADRARVLLALGCVDAVAVFDEDTPERLLAGLRPDVWVKGGDYSGADLPEAALLEEWGGQAVLLPYLDGRSSTSLVARAAEDRPARSGDTAAPCASGGGSAGGVGASDTRARDVGGADAPAAGAEVATAPAAGTVDPNSRATDVGAADARPADARTAAAGVASAPAAGTGATDARAAATGVPEAEARVPRGRGAVGRNAVGRAPMNRNAQGAAAEWGR